MMSRFSGAQIVPLNPVSIVYYAHKNCNSDKKVDLAVGEYKNENGEEWILPTVKKALKLVTEDNGTSFLYKPYLGLESFTLAASKLLLGKDSKAIKENRVIGIQAIGGTGSIRLGFQYLRSILNCTTVFLSDVTWDNHENIIRCSGFEDIRFYRYWNPNRRCLDFNGMIEDLRCAPQNSIVLLHVCCHNPSGCDPTQHQWKTIARIVQDRQLFPYFDNAYQGFATGDLENDSWPVKYFVDKGFELICSQSFSKLFGLYSERIGNLTLVTTSEKYCSAIKSQFAVLVIKGMYGSPVNMSGQIVSTILNTPQLYEEHKECIKIMHQRMCKMREKLRRKLEERRTPRSWKYLTEQIGMFAYTDFTEAQFNYLSSKYIFIIPPGRMNMSGLNEHNLDYVADSIHEAVTKFPE